MDTICKCTVLGLLAFGLNQALAQAPQLGKGARKSGYCGAMTLEEKASLVIGGGRKAAPPANLDGSVIGRTELKVPGAVGITNTVPHLNIPSLCWQMGRQVYVYVQFVKAIQPNAKKCPAGPGCIRSLPMIVAVESAD